MENNKTGGVGGRERKMRRYSTERKEAIIQKMMPPANTLVSILVKEMGVSDGTLYA